MQQIDPGSKQLLQVEADYIAAWRSGRGAAPDSGKLVGLALSGGGIRSATFSLGILQALAHRGLLRKVDYLSTVSGGGYIGSSLAWLTSAAAAKTQTTGSDLTPAEFGCNADDFPYGSEDPRGIGAPTVPAGGSSAAPVPSGPANVNTALDGRKQRYMLRFLRDHGYYLTPGAGISAMSLLGAVIRGTFLNLQVWMPLFVLVITLLLVAGDKLDREHWMRAIPYFIEQIGPDAHCADDDGPEPACELLDRGRIAPPDSRTYLADRALADLHAKIKASSRQLLGFEFALMLGLLIIAAMLCSLVIYSLFTRWSRGRTAAERDRLYQRRRLASRRAGQLIPLILLLLLMGILPLVAIRLHSWFAASGPAALVAGTILSMYSFLKGQDRADSTRPPAIAIAGACLFLFGVALISYQFAFLIYNSADYFERGHHIILALAWVALTLSIASGYFVNLNYISIHRYYRDRLMETFMPDLDTALANRTHMAAGANGFFLHDFASTGEPRCPYPIINTNVVLVNSEIASYQHRGGDNFILSPLYCGSNATGWCDSRNFMDGRMTLPTAVAISGAAANPNTGVGGTGLTRNLFLSLAMSLLNLRLGYWAVHPHFADHAGKRAQTPNHFDPGMYSFGNALGIQRWGFNEKRNFLQLSDGGHFENTGLYELVRRRVRLALCCDGGADPEFSFSDFQTTVRRVEEDFGVKIKTLDKLSPNEMMPGKPKTRVYPGNTGFAERGFMMATITYPDTDEVGWLVFMKTTLIEKVSFRVKGYRAENPDFPDQTTADQFFDEVQFEAYRELGFAIADDMLDHELPSSARQAGFTADTIGQFINGL